MSTSKLDTSGVFQPESNPAAETRLSLPANVVKIRPNGVEFLSTKPLPVWTEMSIDIQSPDAKKVRGTGVVVACQGNRQSGYVVSFIFMNLSRQAQERLSLMAVR